MKRGTLVFAVWVVAALMLTVCAPPPPSSTRSITWYPTSRSGDHLDSNMINAWGLAITPTSPWWISNNGTGTSTLYRVNTGAIPLIVTVPGAMGSQGTPTGLVFNGGTGFVVTIVQARARPVSSSQARTAQSRI